MNLKDQVTNLELSKRLKELDCKQESLWWWVFPDYGMGKPVVIRFDDRTKIYLIKEDPVSAFTCAELGEMLPEIIQLKEGVYELIIYKHNNSWRVGYQKLGRPIDQIAMFEHIKDDTLANTTAKMLIYLIENKLIEGKRN